MDRGEFLKRSRGWLGDAKILYRAKRYDSAVYLCGYAVEFALKARILALHKWKEIPDGRDFSNFRVHDLGVLLRLAGRDQKVRTTHLAEWSGVVQWDPEIRYKPAGSGSPADVLLMIQRAEALLRVL